eukprot:CAMPEP_0183727194 /NCGR_PEP_ID=MMETSP0737-20130205/25082_1 /TAXON_ID=385413 /ORGANISM="Thalassiosira miniscula, Strain CCMP1093" /LENGTH=136 /DNA_ID=CAMNT_0025958767 /DNA_START=173 /DNA_END=583 /DNA_ORIENTATION=-
MNRTITAIASLLLLFASASAFSTTQPLNTQQQHRSLGRAQVPILFATEDENDAVMEQSVETVADEAPKVAVKCPDCDLCDGSGRILGGIGVVLDWWPIKAYRPCPNFVERGGKYVRSGQGLDEIAFGRDSTFQSDN